MDGQTERRRTRSKRAGTGRARADRKVNAKVKTGAPVGNQGRPACRKKPKAKPLPKSSNPLGHTSAHPIFAAGQDNELHTEDWQFRPLLDAPRETLVAACWYEYARESQHVRRTMEEWIRLQEIRRELLPYMEEICKKEAKATEKSARKEQVSRGEGNLSRRRPAPDLIPVPKKNSKWWATHLLLERVIHRHPDLPRSLCDEMSKIYPADEEVDQIEWRAAKDGAPRLRELAEHLANDTPWLLIPPGDRGRAIANRFADRHEVPKSADGVEHFPLRPAAFEAVGWNDFEQPQFTEEQIWKDEDIYYREIDRERGLEILPVQVRWAQFTDNEIIEDARRLLKAIRPNEWKDRAKGSGQGRTEKRWWQAALKELAAMRLTYQYRPAQPHNLKNLPRSGGPADTAIDLFRSHFGAGDQMDNAALGKLRRNAGEVFADFFPVGQQPRHWLTFTQRNRR